MPPSAAQLVTTLVAKVCTLDSNGILLGDILNELDRLGVQVQQALANSPDATQVAALDRWGLRFCVPSCLLMLVQT